jgi:hypothetical protein
MPRQSKKKSVTPEPSLAPRNLNIAAAAAYLGIGPWAMRHLHWDGLVRGFFIGRRLLFDKAVLDAYVDGLVKETVTR